MNIGTLTDEQVARLKADLAKRESGGSGDMMAVNRLGYLGRYQFGAAALEDAGYIKKGTWRKVRSNASLKSPRHWTGKNGASSKETFLGNEAAQEDAMNHLLKQNYRVGTRRGAISPTSDPATIAGFLAASHLGGAGNAIKYYQHGKAFKDGFGTNIAEYAELGATAIV